MEVLGACTQQVTQGTQQVQGGLGGPWVQNRWDLGAESTETSGTRSRLPQSRQPEVLGSRTSRDGLGATSVTDWSLSWLQRGIK